MKRLVILSDCGLDDAVAVAYLVRHGNLFDGIDVVSVAGNVSEQVSFNNLKRLLGALESEKKNSIKNVTLSSSRSILQNDYPLPKVHGSDGMGDLDFKNVCDVTETDISKVLEGLNSMKNGVTVLSLGPLTVTKYLLDYLKVVPELVIMAGIVDETPNFEGVEFNQALDIEAYKYCVNNFNHVIATLDTCRDRSFNLAGQRFGKTVFQRLINRANELAEIRHPDNSYIYDFIASLYLTRQDLFKASKADDRMGSVLNQLKCVNKDFKLKDEVKV